MKKFLDSSLNKIHQKSLELNRSQSRIFRYRTSMHYLDRNLRPPSVQVSSELHPVRKNFHAIAHETKGFSTEAASSPKSFNIKILISININKTQK